VNQFDIHCTAPNKRKYRYLGICPVSRKDQLLAISLIRNNPKIGRSAQAGTAVAPKANQDITLMN